MCETDCNCRHYPSSQAQALRWPGLPALLLYFVPVLAAAMLVALASAQQTGLAPSGTASVTVTSPLQSLNPSDPLLGSVPAGTVSPTSIPLTLLDAINRGLKYNLGLLLSEQENRLAQGARWTARSRLLPNLQLGLTDAEAQVNLATSGFTRNIAPSVGLMLGPYNFYQIGPEMNEVLSFRDLNTWRAAKENIKAARFSYLTTRDLVVLVVGASYLQAQTDAARVESVQAQVQTAQALFDQAQDLRQVGMVAGIDVLRAQVELEAQQQRLVVAQNDYEKQLLMLGRVIGLPPAQKFILTDRMPAPTPVQLSFEEALKRAYESRPDYKRAESQVRSLELLKRAAEGERLPSIGVNGNYAAAGNSALSHGTFTTVGTLQIPVFQGGKVRGDVMQADAQLQQARSQLEDLRARIEFEVRSAFLDVNAASKQLEVATSALDLARQQVAQTRDRFAQGVTNNVEVVQAQQAQATAEENYIAGLFAHNFAKLSLARALGIAEEATRKFLGGK